MTVDLDQDEWRKPRSKKDTKHWCKGKVGREHTPAVEKSEWRHGDTYSVFLFGLCSTCGKRLKEYNNRADLPVMIHEVNGRRL